MKPLQHLHQVLRCTAERAQRPVRLHEAALLVALGSMAPVLLGQPRSIALLALVLLCALVYLGTRQRAKRAGLAASATPPTLLVYRGCVVPVALAAASLSEESLRHLLKANGIGTLKNLHAVVHEPNGQLSIIQSPPATLRYPLHVN